MYIYRSTRTSVQSIDLWNAFISNFLCAPTVLYIITVTAIHRLNMEVDLRSLFGPHVT
jgi:hypothetical protein